MAKKKEAEAEANDYDHPDQGLPGEPDQSLPGGSGRGETVPTVDYNRPVLIEGVNGGPAVEGPIVVQWHERKFTHDGKHYEHVSEEGDYWVYREM